MNNKKHTITRVNDIEALSLRLASPENIKEWSYGEVTKPETINYRTQRSEKNGLFDEKIFGPDRDFECYCGKYKGVRYKGIVCEKCGVEITRSIVRRERMGHIELASPVSHIWFLRSMPSRISLILGITATDVEKVIYFAGYIVTSVSEDERQRLLKELDSEYKGKIQELKTKEEKEELKQRLETAKQEVTGIAEMQVLDELEYHKYSMRYSTLFEAEIGAEAIYNLFKKVDLEALKNQLEEKLSKKRKGDIDKISKRLSLVKAMIAADIRPEWMFLTRIPVIPPALRPMVPLDGGRYATSDVNDLYRRVINRNNRLKRLKDIHAPDVILRNEKRILQEAVDALLDNSLRRGSQSVSQQQRRPLKSLSDNLKSKRGLFRGNLLGKRVDYSGRSVIVVGPTLHLNQCGLPKTMALELFRPFVISELIAREHAFNIRGAGRLIDDGVPEVWEILEDVIQGKYVLLNRAPTLHRLGIQSFQPILIEGQAIQVHPLVCTAFNADFDGDQMAVHVPLSAEAQIEAQHIMASDKNLLKPGSGDPIIAAKMLDIVLGAYWMTKMIDGAKGEGKIFPTPNSAILAYDYGEVDLRALIKVRATNTPRYEHLDETIFETTVGRLLFNSVFPKDYPFQNLEIDRKKMRVIIDELVEKYGLSRLPEIMDKVKAMGFQFATRSGITWGLDDVVIPEGKKAIVDEARRQAEEIKEQYNAGLLSEREKTQKNVEIWHKAKNEVEKLLPDTLSVNGSVHDMIASGARGSLSNITNMVGMKGLIASVSGDALEFPIISSMKEGLTPIEYFITTHGSRKGLTDTALQTAKAGYLTRRLFDVAQDAIVNEEDCGTKTGVKIKRETASGIEIPLSKNIVGRYLSEDIADADGTVHFTKDHYITPQDAHTIDGLSIDEVWVRSPLTCKSLQGICARCYGQDLGSGEPIRVGEAVGTIAAQAIGEPGTQLTMRTFHAGGTASVGGDITQGLPRVEEVFENRSPKSAATIARVNGTITDIEVSGKQKILRILPNVESKGKTKDSEVEYVVGESRMILVKVGDVVEKGDLLTDGSADLNELFKFGGREKTQNYIIREIKRLYELQGENVSRKHIEVIVRQMFSRQKIKDVGESRFSRGDIVEGAQLQEENDRLKKEGKEPAKGETVLMGITEVSLSRKSFLSAASFQHTTRVLISAAIRARKDELKGLKENVIIGRLIPAGTGLEGSAKQQLLAGELEKIQVPETE